MDRSQYSRRETPGDGKGISMKCWYAVQTKHRCEHVADASLQRLQVDTFLPMLTESRTICGLRRVSTAPMFPGYLFALCEIPSQFRTVAYARGVKQVVSFGSGPVALDASVIEAIKAKLQDAVLELPENDFTPGQPVRIQDGPLYGLEAIFQQSMSGAQRSILLLKAVSYQARVILPAKLVANI